MPVRAVGTYVTIVVATLVSAEILARCFDWEPSYELVAGDALGNARYEHASTGVGDLVAHQDGHWVIWFHRPYHVQTNSVGLRNIEEPSAGSFRVLAVGDSQTFGPYLANEDTWPAWTENYLRSYHNGADRVQVFNAGIAGYTILDELALLKEKGVAFKPSLVILAAFENDIDDLSKERAGYVQRPSTGASSLNVLRTTLERRSALVSVAHALHRKIKFALAGVDLKRGERNAIAPAGSLSAVSSVEDQNKQYLVRRYEALFRETATLLKSNNIALAVIFIPAAHTITAEHESVVEPIVRRLASETATPYFDATGAFRARPDPAVRLYLQHRGPQNVFVGNAHLSREGNAVIGQALSDWLMAQKLVPR